MAIRVGWLPTGTQSAEDTRQAVLAMMTQAGLNVARTGYVPGSGGAQPFALASTGSLSCSVGSGQAIVTPGATGTQGSYPVTIDSTGSGLPTVTFAAGGSLARTDVIYLRVQDTAEDGSGITAGTVGVTQGANGGGVPTTPGGSLALWQVPVPASATSINFATATFVAHATVALGGVVPAEDSSAPGSPYKGQVRTRKDLPFTAPGWLEGYDGAAWQSAIPASMPRGIMNAPKTATANSGAVSTPEAIDGPLGTYQFTAVAGRRYRVVVTGLIANGTAGDVYSIRVRDSGNNTTPTNTSTLIAEATFNAQQSGIAGRVQIPLGDTFIAASSGTHTLGVF
ncbi:MAG: hypothetical protein ACRDVE_15715, partial [Actinocrinis sp.]